MMRNMWTCQRYLLCVARCGGQGTGSVAPEPSRQATPCPSHMNPVLACALASKAELSPRQTRWAKSAFSLPVHMGILPRQGKVLGF